MSGDTGQDYAFHVALSDQAESLVRQLRAQDPGAFLYKGLDLGRAFALYVLYTAAQDPALYAWYEKSQGRGGHARPFSEDLAHLLARHWFGAMVPPLSLRLVLRRILRRQKRWLGDPRRRPLHGQNYPPHCEVVFFAQVTRFARYLEPLPDCFPGRHTWLVPAEPWSEDLQRQLFDTSRPFLTIGTLRPSLAPIGSALRRYAPELALESDAMDVALSRLSPKVIVLPEGNHPRDEIINRVAKRRGIAVLCLQQGWSPLVHAGFRNMDYSTMTVWGPGFSSLMSPANPKQRFCVTGHHKLHKPGGGPHPLGILFLCQGSDKWIGAGGEKLHLALAERLAAARPQLSVIVRPHPALSLAPELVSRLVRYSNVQIQNAAQVSLADAFAGVQLSVSIFSSTILESAAAGVIPIVFNMTSMPRYQPDVEAAGAGIEVRTLDEACEAILPLLDDDARRAAMVARLPDFAGAYFAHYADDAVARIVAEIERLAQ
jgi:hypothetical protein